MLRQFASIPATSVQSERLFSSAGLLYANGLRTNLSAQKAEELLLVRANSVPLKVAMGENDWSSDGDHESDDSSGTNDP